MPQPLRDEVLQVAVALNGGNLRGLDEIRGQIHRFLHLAHVSTTVTMHPCRFRASPRRVIPELRFISTICWFGPSLSSRFRSASGRKISFVTRTIWNPSS